MRIVVWFVISFLVLVGYSETNKFEQTFVGHSDHWEAVVKQKAKVIYKGNDAADGRATVSYDINETLTLTYRGETSEIDGKQVEFIFESRSGRQTTITNAHIGQDQKVTLQSSSANVGTLDYPKGRRYPAVTPKDKSIKVIVKWEGMEETIELVFSE